MYCPVSCHIDSHVMRHCCHSLRSFTKQFHCGVKQRCTLHFIQITFDVPVHTGILHPPWLSHIIASVICCPCRHPGLEREPCVPSSSSSPHTFGKSRHWFTHFSCLFLYFVINIRWDFSNMLLCSILPYVHNVYLSVKNVKRL